MPDSDSSDDMPIARFYRLIEETRPPMRADRSAMGTLPTRAYRYCEAVTSATGHGWWVFPPAELRLMWDGTEIFWAPPDGGDAWEPLSPTAQLPGLPAAFDAAAPESLQGCVPPMMTALPEPGALQIWTGLMVRTRPGWHLMLRAPVNMASAGGIAIFEGIVETDSWFGPLFTNLRFTRSHTPVVLSANYPLIQVQPIRDDAYGDEIGDSVAFVPGMDGLSEADWMDYHRTIVVPNEDPDRPFGAYAKKSRKRKRSDTGDGIPAAAIMAGRCPVTGRAAV